MSVRILITSFNLKVNSERNKKIIRNEKYLSFYLITPS